MLCKLKALGFSFVRRFVAEGGGEGLELLFDFGAGKGFAVAGNKNARV